MGEVQEPREKNNYHEDLVGTIRSAYLFCGFCGLAEGRGFNLQRVLLVCLFFFCPAEPESDLGTVLTCIHVQSLLSYEFATDC